MLPTVAGAWLGVSTGIVASLGVGMSLILFLGVSFGFMWAIEKNKDRAAGVYLLLGFTFFMGLMLSRLVGQVLGFSNGGKLVATAFAGTSAVFCAMAMLSSVVKRDVSSMGKFLTVGAVILLVAVVANVFLQSSALMLTMSGGDARPVQRLLVLRPEAHHGRRRDELRHRHAGRLPGRVQHLPEPAVPAGHLRRRARVSA
jgi:modulator of FtsH protease